MKKGLVSIVVPVYNAERYLKDTLQTVLDQTYEKWELLLVDDCSTDTSVEIIKTYKDKRIKLILQEKNSGAAVTRNRGIVEATGEYIAFLDADDIWMQNKLKNQIQFMKEKKCAFSFSSYEFADEFGKSSGKKICIPKTLSYRQALKNTIISTPSVIFNMKLMNKDLIYFPNVKSEDTANWWSILKQGYIAYGFDEVTYYYRRSTKSLSANKLEAIKRIWNLYRKQEKLGILYSGYNFCFYVFNTVKKRIIR